MSEEHLEDNIGRKSKATQEAMFFLACLDNKPIGKAKHFQMLGICQSLLEMSHEVPNKNVLWEKFNLLVNLKLLEEKDDEEKDDTDRAHDACLQTNEDFKLPDDIVEFMTEDIDNMKCDVKEEDEVTMKTVKPIKDYTRNRTPKIKPKEEEVESKEDSQPESDEDIPLRPTKVLRRSQAPSSSKKAVIVSRKLTPKRSQRGAKELLDKDVSPASTSSKKTDEEVPISAKKASANKRSLRSRGDDDNSTPPPNTRSRRI